MLTPFGNVIKYEATKYQTAVENYAMCMDAHYKTYLKAVYPYLDRGWKRNAFLRQVEGNDAPALPTNITEARFTEDVANERINFRGVKADFASMFLFRRKMLLALQGPDDKRFSLLPLPSIGLHYVTLDLNTLRTVSTRFRKTNRELYDLVHAETTRSSSAPQWEAGGRRAPRSLPTAWSFVREERGVQPNQEGKDAPRRPHQQADVHSGGL